MTTRRERTPVLDRQLERSVTTTVEVPATMVYAFDTLYAGGGDNLDAGQWRRDSDNALSIGLADAEGVDFPSDLSLPASVAVAWDGAAASDLNITAIETRRNPISFQPYSLRLTFDAALPAAGAALTITVASGGTTTTTQTVTRPVWCALRDFTGRDQLNIGDGSFFELSDTRIIVRAEGPAWDVGDAFTLEGEGYTVRAVSQLGRSRHLELLARSVG